MGEILQSSGQTCQYTYSEQSSTDASSQLLIESTVPQLVTAQYTLGYTGKDRKKSDDNKGSQSTKVIDVLTHTVSRQGCSENDGRWTKLVIDGNPKECQSLRGR